ncbi:hypothetical protein L210DRAFT_3641170 [Boletus edulis BED1]|uniref:Fungal-type protein kinase domain-containing protein n=1 Tax=Boletus edulis BED1 TaxID=1328754 RepID=A0AAD4C2V6_BOLED|nr:hypothetical protein L210DRAFT_3641170 [Boletus edulis BED1]
MSHTYQDETSALSGSTATLKPLRDTQCALASESTAATKPVSELPYTSAPPQTLRDIRYDIGKETSGRWLGAMPIDTFLDKYVPATKEPLPDLPNDLFENFLTGGTKVQRYDHFITAIRVWMPHLDVVNTSTKGEIVNKVNLKTDISIYNRVEGVAPPDRTDFSRMELWIKFEEDKDDAAFQDPRDGTEEERLLAIETESFTPDTDKGNEARGQLAQYAGVQHSLQSWHFSFSVVVHGDHARFLRWDQSATVVTAAFNYRTNPRSMAEFLWRFNHLSPEQRGRDVSVQPANLTPEVDARILGKLGIKDVNIPLYKYEVPGLAGIGYAYGPRPPLEDHSLVIQRTHSLPMVWIPTKHMSTRPDSCDGPGSPSERNIDPSTGHDDVEEGWRSEERLIYMKDTWRFLSDLPDVEIKAEHEIYKILHDHQTPNIPKLVAGGDVEGGRTQTRELVNAPWLCVNPRISLYQHYRLVHGIVGRPLFKFECTKQLLTAVFDALQAHAHAVNCARILHCDISSGNIILTDEGRGLLIDWELAEMMDKCGSEGGRTGTWPFMSANLLMHPSKIHTVTDDLESFMHVLAWMTLRFVPAIELYEDVFRAHDMVMFNQRFVREGRSDRGGRRKRRAFRGQSYPSQTYKPRTPTPLWDLFSKLTSPFTSLYDPQPPTAEARKKIDIPKSEFDEGIEYLSCQIRHYDSNIERLQSASWFIITMKAALEERKWPTDDKFEENLPIFYDYWAQRQLQHWTRLYTESVWENPKHNLKRAASPISEPSAKRRRISPAASGAEN